MITAACRMLVIYLVWRQKEEGKEKASALSRPHEHSQVDGGAECRRAYRKS